jgi:hypothetical protein
MFTRLVGKKVGNLSRKKERNKRYQEDEGQKAGLHPSMIMNIMTIIAKPFDDTQVLGSF